MKLLKHRNFSSYIEGSVGSNAYRHIFVCDDNGEERDIVEDGQLSCAYFASSAMLVAGLIKSVHATVASTLKDMEVSGWVRVSEPRPGCVILWASDLEAGAQHAHVGFYVGNDEAISNSTSERVPRRHHVTYGVNDDGTPKRPIVSYWWHSDLES